MCLDADVNNKASTTHLGNHVFLMKNVRTSAKHSVGSVQNRTEPKETKTEFINFPGPNLVYGPNRNQTEIIRFGSVLSLRTELFLSKI